MTKRRSWRVKSGAGRRRECAKCSVSHYSHGLTMRSVQTRTAQRQSVMQKSNCSAFDTSIAWCFGKSDHRSRFTDIVCCSDWNSHLSVTCPSLNYFIVSLYWMPGQNPVTKSLHKFYIGLKPIHMPYYLHTYVLNLNTRKDTELLIQGRTFFLDVDNTTTSDF